jgi:hypothetical protein
MSYYNGSHVIVRNNDNCDVFNDNISAVDVMWHQMRQKSYVHMGGFSRRGYCSLFSAG